MSFAGGSPLNTELEAARPSTAGEEELQLQLAIAMSKEEADEDEKRRKGDEIKLQMAIEESKKSQEVSHIGTKSLTVTPQWICILPEMLEILRDSLQTWEYSLLCKLCRQPVNSGAKIHGIHKLLEY